MDIGFIGMAATTETAFPFPLICRNGSLVPTTPTGTPTYAIYSADDLSSSISTGNMAAADVDSKTGNRSVAVDLSAIAELEAGKMYLVVMTYVATAVTYNVAATFLAQ